MQNGEGTVKVVTVEVEEVGRSSTMIIIMDPTLIHAKSNGR